ncbi:hypothetical protein MFRU_007g02610 [Monilinia fructicola]|nr:hypothetical protein MFRU_007g02610 [Monilinia fructicola]
MGSATSSYVSSDTNIERYMCEKETRKAVLAAGKKAKRRGLCKKCDQIVGWFFLDPEVFRRTFEPYKDHKSQVICKVEINKLKPSCKVCNFLYAIRSGKERNENKSGGTFTLERLTVGAMFRFRSGYDNSAIFFLNLPRFDRLTRTVFGCYNANAYQDGVAIRRLSSNANLSLIREWIRLCDNNHADSNFDCLPNGEISLHGFMVIDCEDGRNILVPGTTSMKNVTLSYVWGAEVSDGPDQLGRLPSTLPDLVTGVINVVIALGYVLVD